MAAACVIATGTTAALVALVPGAAGAAGTSLPPGPALAATADTSWWGTNGRVTDIVSDGSSAWISGAFDYVGPGTGRGVRVDTTTGAKLSTDDIRVDDPVRAAVPDGAGGYYMAGDFARVGTARRDGLVHVTAAGTIDKSFSPKVTGNVFALASAGDRLIVTGDFTAVNGTAVSRIAAIGLDGALVPGWSASLSGPGQALHVAGDSVYVGGAFTSVSGASRTNLARLGTATGAVDSFAPRPNGVVRAVDVVVGATRSDDVVAVGGDFTTVATTSTVAHNHLATLTGAGADTGWSPNVAGSVSAVAVSPDHQSLLVGGSFTAVNGAARVGVARLALGGGTLAFDAGLSGCQLPHVTQNTNQLVPCSTDVSSVAWSDAGDRIYVGGLFTSTQGAVRHDAASYAAATGAVTSWLPMPSARVRAILPLASGVVLGGDFTSVGGLYRQGLAKIDLSTGRADPAFVSDVDNIVLDIELDQSGALYAGGSFRFVNGVARNKVVKVSAATGAVDATFRQGANKDVDSLAVRGASLYLGGLFTKIGTVTRKHAAKVSTVTGAADPGWLADTDGPGGAQKNGGVFSLAVTPDSSRVFLAGGFSSVNGSATRGGIIAVDGATGAVNPSRLGGVQGCGSTLWVNRIQLSQDGTRLYGGDVCPDAVYQWDAVNLATQRTDGLLWRTNCNGGMQGRLEVNGHFYYGSHGGDRGNGGWCLATPGGPQVSQQRAFVFGAGDGGLLDWHPEFDTPMGVWSYAAVPQGLLVGGDFFIAGDRDTQQQGLALFRGTP